MAIEFCITHWQGIRRSAQGGVPSGWSQSVVTLRGVPAEIDGWGDMGLFAPSRCVEVVSRVVGGTPHGCEMFGVQVGTVHTVKTAGSRRNRMVGVGYVETSPAQMLRSTDYRALLGELPFLDGSHPALLEAACAHLASTVIVEAERLGGIRAARIDAFLASLPVVA